MNLQLRAIEATDLDRRLTKIEKLLAAGNGIVQETDTDHPVPAFQRDETSVGVGGRAQLEHGE